MEVFSNYAIVVYAFAFITIMNYSNFEENQKVFLMYAISCIAVVLNIFSVFITELMLISMLFVSLEYLSADKTKMKLVRGLSDKLLDASYMMIFEYHILPIVTSLILIDKAGAFENNAVKIFMYVLSILLLIYSLHYCISSKLIVKKAGEILDEFIAINPKVIDWESFDKLPYNILISIEDHSYFIRGSKSYSLLSIGYIKYGWNYVKNMYSKCISMPDAIGYVKRYVAKNNFKRGYSTLEMQLIKQLSVLSDYESHKIIRKIYELVYIKVILNSIKNFRGFEDTDNFKRYLLYIYFDKVSLRVNDVYYRNFYEYIGEDFSKWDKEKFFIACCAVRQQKDTLARVEAFSCLAEEYGVDMKKVYELLE